MNLPCSPRVVRQPTLSSRSPTHLPPCPLSGPSTQTGEASARTLQPNVCLPRAGACRGTESSDKGPVVTLGPWDSLMGGSGLGALVGGG